jgi:hypothetical protein
VSIICAIVDTTIPLTFLGEVDVCELYYLLARVFSRASLGYSWFDGLLRNPWSGVQNPSGARVQWIEGS